MKQSRQEQKIKSFFLPNFGLCNAAFVLSIAVTASSTTEAFTFDKAAFHSSAIHSPNYMAFNFPRRRHTQSVLPMVAPTTTPTRFTCASTTRSALSAESSSRDDSPRVAGTESKLSATTNLAKCICGAGSFALPHVFLEEGVIGGTIALTACGFLATYTMQSLSRSKEIVGSASYVELAKSTLGPNAARLVFTLTLCASLGVCSSYLVFIGQTLESLSCDATSENIVRQLLPNVSTVVWEMGTAALLFPLCLLRSYAIFAFTSALGVVAVLGGIVVTLASGIFEDPGGGIVVALSNVAQQPMFPASFAKAFGGSFGTVAFLFCINFLTFPIMNSMKEPKEYASSIQTAVFGTAFFNIIFAALCVGFYGEDTADLVLSNLGNGSYLSALKLLLCVDLLFTFPIVFSSGRQIAENALISRNDNDGGGEIAMARLKDEDDESSLLLARAGQTVDYADESSVALARAGIAASGVFICFTLAQIGGFGTVANLVGGVAQGTLAFIMPPLIAVALARRGDGTLDAGGEVGQCALLLFGVSVVASTSYFTATGMLGG
jgi:amino acid permease